MANDATLVDLLDNAGTQYSMSPIHFPRSRETITLRELRERSGIFAAGLREIGVTHGELVGVLLPTSPEFLIALFGILCAGATAAPLPTPQSFIDQAAHTSRLHHILADSGIRRVVTSLSLAEQHAAEPRTVQFLTTSSVLESSRGSYRVRGDSDALALVQYTSGSTSSPKGVALTHFNVVSGINAILTAINGSARDVTAQWLPLYHDMGLIGMLTAVACGSSQYLWPASAFIRNPSHWLREFSRYRATVYLGPTFSYSYMLQNVRCDRPSELDLSSWRIAFIGAEQVNADIVEKFTRHFSKAGFRPQAILPAYGLAEATLAVALPNPDEEPYVDWVDAVTLANDYRVEKVSRDACHARGIVSVGSPVLGHKVRIVDENHQELPDNRVGEIQVSGPAVMSGYYGKPSDTEAAICNGWLLTGDLGYKARNRLFVTGRKKELIKVRGVSFYPEDVEALVRSIPGVYRQQCVAVPLTSTTEEIMAVLLETRLPTPAERDELAHAVLKTLTIQLGQEHVKLFLLRPNSIPRTTSGKFQRVPIRTLILNDGFGRQLLGLYHGNGLMAGMQKPQELGAGAK